MTAPPTDDAAIDAFLSAFEQCVLPTAQWTHAAHLFTGACYVHTFGEAAALTRLRQRLHAYHLAAGGQHTATSGYHETITVFWIKLLTLLRDGHPHLSRGAFAALAVDRFAASRGILGEFYSFDVAASTQARARWVPPDLQPLRCSS